MCGLYAHQTSNSDLLKLQNQIRRNCYIRGNPFWVMEGWRREESRVAITRSSVELQDKKKPGNNAHFPGRATASIEIVATETRWVKPPAVVACSMYYATELVLPVGVTYTSPPSVVSRYPSMGSMVIAHGSMWVRLHGAFFFSPNHGRKSKRHYKNRFIRSKGCHAKKNEN